MKILLTILPALFLAAPCIAAPGQHHAPPPHRAAAKAEVGIASIYARPHTRNLKEWLDKWSGYAVTCNLTTDNLPEKRRSSSL